MDTATLQNLHDRLAGEMASVAEQRANLLSAKSEKTAAAEGMRKAYIAATISGKPFDRGDEFRSLRDEIGIIDDALVENEREDDRLRPRLRKVARQLDVQTHGREMMALAERVHDALTAAQKAGQEMVEKLAEVYRLSRDIETVDGALRHMTGEGGGEPFFDAALLNRLGERMCRLLNVVHKGSLGELRWLVAQDRLTPEVWADEEWQLQSSHILGRVKAVTRTLDAIEAEELAEQEQIDAEGDGRDDDATGD